MIVITVIFLPAQTMSLGYLKEGRLVQISIRNKEHKIKMVFSVTSGEILHKREIDAYIMSVDESCWKDL
jgi:hypothetical protein